MRRNGKTILPRMGLVVAAAFLATPGATAQTGAAAQRVLVLEGGTLIDGTGKPPVPDSVIVVEGNRIKAVGKRGQVQIPAGATVIKLDGRTILPGLIDAHVHLQDWQLPMFLPYGVTTIADLNNDGPWILAQREALKKGMIKGPRMFVSGTFIWGRLRPEPGGTFTTPSTDTVEETRARVRELVASGVDIIKVDNGLSDEQLRAVVEEANRAGFPALGHTQNILRAAKVGFKMEEHMDTMARALLDPDEKLSPKLYPNPGGPIEPPGVPLESQLDPKTYPPLIDYMVKQGVFLNPTLMAHWAASTPRWKDRARLAAQLLKDHAGELGFVPDDMKKGWVSPWGLPRDKDGRSYANISEFIREYAAAGGKVVGATDTGYNTNNALPGLSMDIEMQMLTDLGIPPMKAIEGDTLWAAQMLKKDKDLGSVEPGKIADFLVIEGNPLTDISTIRNVRLVIKDGAVVDTKYDPHWVNPMPEPFTSSFRQPPEIIAFSPRMAPQGSPATTVEIDGNRFTRDAIVRFDTTDLPTHFVSATKLTVTLGARLLQRHPGSYAFYVVNPGLHGNVSTTAYFLVNLKR